jgi:hypothetical protein
MQSSTRRAVFFTLLAGLGLSLPARLFIGLNPLLFLLPMLTFRILEKRWKNELDDSFEHISQDKSGFRLQNGMLNQAPTKHLYAENIEFVKSLFAVGATVLAATALLVIIKLTLLAKISWLGVLLSAILMLKPIPWLRDQGLKAAEGKIHHAYKSQAAIFVGYVILLLTGLSAKFAIGFGMMGLLALVGDEGKTGGQQVGNGKPPSESGKLEGLWSNIEITMLLIAIVAIPNSFLMQDVWIFFPCLMVAVGSELIKFNVQKWVDERQMQVRNPGGGSKAGVELPKNKLSLNIGVFPSPSDKFPGEGNTLGSGK